MRNQPSQPGTLDEYAELMGSIDMPQGVRSAVMTEAHEAEANTEAASAQAANDRTARNSSLPASERQARIVDGDVQNSASSHAERAASPVQHAKPTRQIAPRRTRSRWIGIAACLVLAMGIGALALTVGPFAAQHDTAREDTGSGLVSSDALPEGNFFTLAAYADEASRPADAGTTIDLDASGIRPVNYNNAWIDPETGEQADGRAFAGMKAGMNASVAGNSVETSPIPSRARGRTWKRYRTVLSHRKRSTLSGKEKPTFSSTPTFSVPNPSLSTTTMSHSKTECRSATSPLSSASI